MNWGWKIVVLYSAFVIMTLSMVFFFMRQKVDLVADDYY
ncbi:MAG: FixH family protein, partial [Cyclobacteriaceae bacterium]|nr:FixH family protein [Cyclobacteriaceae bacterium]